MRVNKFEREKYGISVDLMSRMCGLSTARIKEVEDGYLDLIGRGIPESRLKATADGDRMFAVVDEIKAEQDKTVEALIGRLISSGVDVSLKTLHHPGRTTTYQVELSCNDYAGKGLSSIGRGSSQLSALTSSIDVMRGVVGMVSPLFPVTSKEAA
ncbi:hypothetical protein [Rhizobium aethiopicum]|uniref:Uncharacterized protein n=1 Tax=Rhizobium aethiopicum TaxID=1138170 RepID=A0A7W6MI67_9HYPH|nr:hypothetical protein [Rhizobium aethiopicum]MBB4192834.1 hypothetical protein [Rhizobium aethiopicum]